MKEGKQGKEGRKGSRKGRTEGGREEGRKEGRREGGEDRERKGKKGKERKRKENKDRHSCRLCGEPSVHPIPTSQSRIGCSLAADPGSDHNTSLRCCVRVLAPWMRFPCYICV